MPLSLASAGSGKLLCKEEEKGVLESKIEEVLCPPSML
jgi:hypothetical protein